MRKNTTLSIVLATCLALPTLAPAGTFDWHGFIRTRAMTFDHSFSKDVNPDSLVDNRFRGKATWHVNDYLSGTYYGEVDFQWGDDSKANGRNGGGGLGGDTVNLETKNLYMDVKIPDSGVSARLGLQTVVDRLHHQVILGDAAGLRFRGKHGLYLWSLGWFKLSEGEQDEGSGSNNFPLQANKLDDTNMWLAQVGYAADKDHRAGFDLYYMSNQGSGLRVDARPTEEIGRTLVVLPDHRAIGFASEDTFLLGPQLSAWKLPWATLSGYFAYNFGKVTDAVLLDGRETDVNIRAYNFGAKGVFDLAKVKTGVELFYWSGDDDLSDDTQTFYHTPQWSTNSTASSVIPSGTEGLMVLLGDVYSTTVPAGPGGRAITGRAHSDGGFTGFGMTGIVLNGRYSPQFNQNIYLKGALGYFRVLEDELKLTDTESIKREGKTMGTEVGVRIGYKMQKNLDISVNGAYAFLGAFYDKTASQGMSPSPYYASSPSDDDPDNPYVAYLMAQLSW